MRTQSIAGAAALMLQLHGGAAAPVKESRTITLQPLNATDDCYFGGGPVLKTTVGNAIDMAKSKRCGGWNPAWGHGPVVRPEPLSSVSIQSNAQTVDRRLAPPCVVGDDGECHVPEGWSARLPHGGGMMPSVAPAPETDVDDAQQEKRMFRDTDTYGQVEEMPHTTIGVIVQPKNSNATTMGGNTTGSSNDNDGPAGPVDSDILGGLENCPAVARRRRNDGSWGCGGCNTEAGVC